MKEELVASGVSKYGRYTFDFYSNHSFEDVSVVHSTGIADKISKLDDKINRLLEHLKLEEKEVDEIPAKTIIVKKRKEYKMSIATFETAVVNDLKRKYPELKSLKKKHLMEWSTTPVKAEEGETLFESDDPHTYCAISNEAIKRK